MSQLQLNKRVSQALPFLVSYTVREMKDADSARPGVSGLSAPTFIGSIYNRKAEKAVSQLRYAELWYMVY